MKTLLLASPFIFGLLDILIWVGFRRFGWTRRSTRFVLGMAASALLIYAVGWALVPIGSMLHNGSNEPFGWGPTVIVPMARIAGGILLAAASTLVALILGLLTAIRRK
jgi:hypothetical protein